MSVADAVRDLVDAGAEAGEYADLAPMVMEAAYVRRTDVHLFDGVASVDKDPRRSLQVGTVDVPPVGPGEALIAVMAAGLNHNTVWSSLFEPEPGFNYLDRAVDRAAGERPANVHVLGSDAAGVVIRLGPGPSRFQPGDHVTVSPTFIENRAMSMVDDALEDPGMRAWGFETNHGSLAEFALVRTDQLLPKPAHLSWAESATVQLVAATAYRMLIGRNGARMRLGEVVLVWGAAGGLGSAASQLVSRAGGIPVCVVSSAEKVERLHRCGFKHVIERRDEGFQFWDGDAIDLRACGRFRNRIRKAVGEDPDVVFEHTGRATFPASVVVAKRGGRIVTCASTSGYEHTYDNRFLWMNVKRIIGSHGGTYQENWAANRLACKGLFHPTVTELVPLGAAPEAVASIHRNGHVGKIAVLCIAECGQAGVTDPERREQLLPEMRAFSPATT